MLYVIMAPDIAWRLFKIVDIFDLEISVYEIVFYNGVPSYWIECANIHVQRNCVTANFVPKAYKNFFLVCVYVSLYAEECVAMHFSNPIEIHVVNMLSLDWKCTCTHMSEN